MITYALFILYSIFAVIYSKNQFDDEKVGWSNAKGKWHIDGFMMRVIFVFVAAIHNEWQDIILAEAIAEWIYELGMNKYALKVKLFYIGSTTRWDKALGKNKWYYLAGFLVIAIFLKVFIK